MLDIDGFKSSYVKDLTGQIFGYLKVKKFHNLDKYKCAWWECECLLDGNIKRLKGTVLVQGFAISCGCRKGGKEDKGVAGLNIIFGQYIRTAKRRGYDFLLTKDQFKDIVSSNCFYCGIEPLQKSVYKKNTYTKEGMDNAQFLYNGIDRVNNEKGYIMGNVLPCCRICNLAKKSMYFSEFIEWIDRAAKHLGSKGMLPKEVIEFIVA